MPPDRSNVHLLYAARCLRGFGDGFAVIILPAYLSAIGLSPIEIGFVAAASLFGTAVLTLLIGLIAPQHDLRNMALLGAALMVLTGVAFPGFEQVALIAGVAFIGTINPSTGDIGVLVPLEHALLARSIADEERTRTFARYSLIGALSMAAGALAAGATDILVARGLSNLAAFKLSFYLYALLGLMAAAVYRSPGVLEVEERPVPRPGADQLVVRVHSCGICASDIHQLRDGWGTQPGTVAGHEWSGTIAAMASNGCAMMCPLVWVSRRLPNEGRCGEPESWMQSGTPRRSTSAQSGAWSSW